MNNVVLVGRLTRDPNVRYTPSQMCIARFTVACDRAFKREGQPDADFISCVAFGKQGEFIEKYFTQGRLIGIQGSLQTGSYEKDGQKIYTTDVVVDRAEFVGSKSDNGGSRNDSRSAAPSKGGFEELVDNKTDDTSFETIEDDLPF